MVTDGLTMTSETQQHAPRWRRKRRGSGRKDVFRGPCGGGAWGLTLCAYNGLLPGPAPHALHGAVGNPAYSCQIEFVSHFFCKWATRKPVSVTGAPALLVRPKAMINAEIETLPKAEGAEWAELAPKEGGRKSSPRRKGPVFGPAHAVQQAPEWRFWTAGSTVDPETIRFWPCVSRGFTCMDATKTIFDPGFGILGCGWGGTTVSILLCHFT